MGDMYPCKTVHAQVHPVHSSYWNQVEGSFQVDLCLHYIDVAIDDPACSDLIPKFSVYYIWICVCFGFKRRNRVSVCQCRQAAR